LLKARQHGLSKVVDADQLIDCVKKSTNAVVLSHEKESTTRLFEAVKYYVDNMEVKPVVSIDSQSAMKFPKRGSNYFIGTAGQRAFGRGDTIDRAHLSECSFYLDFEKTLAGISEAAEYGQIDCETTPNGRDAFYDMWQKAKEGKSPYTPIFIPWFLNPEYSADQMTESDKEGLSVSVQKLFFIPNDEFLAGIDEEEKRLVARVAAEYGTTLTAGQLKWRRYKIWDKGIFFYQEYPEDDVSCFLQSGRSVFIKITTNTANKIPLDEIARGNGTEWPGLDKLTLFGAVDGAEGVKGGDSHCFAVLNAPASNPKAQIVYEYASTEPIDVFWAKIAPVVRHFNIRVAIEKNGVGVAHVEHAKKLGDIYYEEWGTTAANRPTMITELEQAYRHEDLIESYTEAENEARDMIYTTGNRAEHQKGKHDDRIFARAIAWQMRNAPMPGIDWG
jgi:hypothetical protein